MSMVEIEKIKKRLDDIFKLDSADPDMPFSRFFGKIYASIGVDGNEYFTQSFLQNTNGMMIENSKTVVMVYGTVFVSDEIVDKILNQEVKENVLIFSHHPLGLESSGRGFIPLSEDRLQKLKEKKISIYVVHTPLDIGESISPSKSLANEFGLINQKRYIEENGNLVGIIGDLDEEMKFEDFLEYIKNRLGISELYYHKARGYVKTVGILAGGGTNIRYVNDSILGGCDTYLTGDYLNNVNEVGCLEEKKEMEVFLKNCPINMIAASHYATERNVMINEIKQLFRLFGVHYEFISQNNPWE